jgi:hexosaminidase
LPKDIVVQSWRGQGSLAAAAKQGYRGILSFGYYVDLMWPASRHYAVDPISAAANLSPDEKRLILGGEACMWSEYVSPENIDSRIWPRTAAIAERLWSPQDVTDVNSMYQRLENISRWLDWLGLTHNSSYGPMLRRIAGTNDISVLRTFTDVVEPVKDYNREELAVVEATSLSPLNRVIDATRPESMTARRFANLVDALIGGHADSEAKQEVRASLIRWRDNQSNLQPLESQSFLLTEIVRLSQDLTAVATTGLQALDYLDRGERAPAAWATQQFALLEQAQKPKAQLLLMVVPSVQKLVEASSGQKAPPPPP